MDTGQNTHELFGCIAVERGYISPLELDEACRKQRTTHANSKLGEILIDCGYMSRSDVAEVLKLQGVAIPAGWEEASQPKEAEPKRRYHPIPKIDNLVPMIVISVSSINGVNLQGDPAFELKVFRQENENNAMVVERTLRELNTLLGQEIDEFYPANPGRIKIKSPEELRQEREEAEAQVLASMLQPNGHPLFPERLYSDTRTIINPADVYIDPTDEFLAQYTNPEGSLPNFQQNEPPSRTDDPGGGVIIDCGGPRSQFIAETQQSTQEKPKKE